MSHPTRTDDLATRTGQIEMILRQIDSLPTLAPVAMRLMRIGSIEDADLDHLVEVIEADPPLSARLLGLCRRADKGLGDRITTVRRAVVMLGLETVQAAALSIAVFETMQACSPRLDEEIADSTARRPAHPILDSAPDVHPAFDRTGFWRHSIAVATASERIAEANLAFGVRPEEAFVAGLLHDLGKLVLHVILPRSYARIISLAERRHCSSADVEGQVLGMDHHAAGRRIAEHWGLPSALCDCIWLHGSAGAGVQALPELPHRNLIFVVAVARTLCRHLHLGWCGDFNHPESLEVLCQRSIETDHSAARSAGGADQAGRAATRKSPPARAIASRSIGACADGLHEAVLLRCRALGLGEEHAPQLIMQSLGAANRRLGRISTDLRQRTLTAEAQTAALDAIANLHQSTHLHCGLMETLASIVLSAARAFGNGFYATVHQMRPGESWNMTTFSSDGRLLRSSPIETPHDRETGRYRSLADLGQSPASLDAMGALPWLADHLLDAPDLGRVQVLPLENLASLPRTARPGPAAVLLHDTAPLADELAMRALISSWGAAFTGAAQHESARRFADQLASANRALAEAESRMAELQSLARMGEMAAGAAHEMNNPLAVISGRAEMLAEHAAAESDREIARAIVDASTRLSDLITAMAAIANPPAPSPAPANLHEVIDEAVRQAQTKLGSSTPVHCEVSTEEIIIDRELLVSSLAELIANALEAAPRGIVSVQTQIVPVDGRLILTVTDDGAGMTPHAQQHAFDAFFSQHPAGRRTGLGLTRARRLIEHCGGHLFLRSRPDGQRGTQATIELPPSLEFAASQSTQQNASPTCQAP